MKAVLQLPLVSLLFCRFITSFPSGWRCQGLGLGHLGVCSRRGTHPRNLSSLFRVLIFLLEHNVPFGSVSPSVPQCSDSATCVKTFLSTVVYPHGALFAREVSLKSRRGQGSASEPPQGTRTHADVCAARAAVSRDVFYQRFCCCGSFCRQIVLYAFATVSRDRCGVSARLGADSEIDADARSGMAVVSYCVSLFCLSWHGDSSDAQWCTLLKHTVYNTPHSAPTHAHAHTPSSYCC